MTNMERDVAEAYRTSLLLRANLPSWEELVELCRTHAVESGVRSLTHMDRQLQLIDSRSRVAMRATTADLQELLRGFRNEDAELAALIESPLAHDYRVGGDRRPNATIHWKANREVSIRIEVGLRLALDDSLLSACSALGFATNLNDEAGQYGQAVLTVGDEDGHRYRDYRLPWYTKLTRRRSHYLQHIPLCISRISSAELLSDLALRWATLHEQAHWLCGHLDYLLDCRRSASLMLDELRAAPVSSETPEQAEIVDRCLEMHADSVATQFLFFLGLADDWLQTPSAQRFISRMARFDDSMAARCLDPKDRMARFRILLLGAGAACLVFEKRRQHTRAAARTHPRPATRLINIVVTAVSTYGDLAHYWSNAPVNSDTYLTELLAPALREAYVALNELMLFASLIGVENTDYSYAVRGERIDLSQLAPLADEVFRFATGDRSPRTAAGREYQELYQSSNEVWHALARWSRLGRWGEDDANDSG